MRWTSLRSAAVGGVKRGWRWVIAKAEQCFRKAIELDPNDELTRVNLELMLARGQWEDDSRSI